MAKVKRDRANTRNNKLSWIYRKKAKSRKNRNVTQPANSNSQTQNKNARIIVRNLPFKATQEDVRKFFEEFGQIDEINILQHPNGKPVGCGFIQFKHMPDASKAIFNTNKKEFLGRTIISTWAIPKSKFCQQLEELAAKNKEDADQTEKSSVTVIDMENEEKEQGEENKKEEQREENMEKEQGKEIREETEGKEQKRKKKSQSAEKKQMQRKIHKLKKRKKRARVIVRNLSFQATEEDLKKQFSRYGNIEEIKILTRPDGKRVGCGFVQFELAQSAAMAIHHENLKPLLNRPIVVDWAVPKDKYCAEVKKEKSTDTEIKTEPGEVKEEDDVSVKEENDDTIEMNGLDEDVNSIGDEETADSNESDGDSATSDEENSIKAEEKEETEETAKRPRRVSNDITEGKTVFLKNVPFSVKNEELKTFMEQFGPVYYALVCIDPLTEHSKGTAFVKFKNTEDAEKCLAAGSELALRGQTLEAHKALNKNDVENKKNLKDQRNKDSRNLYLVKEGVIPAGSPAAEGVSATDMAKRLQLEQWKSQMLRNLNMFVSRVRLVVHNLPPTFDDSKLRQLFKNHGGSKSIIKEARVMRDLKNIDANGVGKSKEYGFVTFTSHEDALKALRSINNNPNIFSKHKRPIVAFSIENRVMVNAKQRRIQKSRERNPLWPGNNVKRKNEKTEEKNTKRQKPEEVKEDNAESYSGITSKPGQIKLTTKSKLRKQALIHSKTVKKEKKKTKAMKKSQIKRNEETQSKKEPKPKQGAKFDLDDAHFTKLVNNYKDKLKAIGGTKSKWYET